MWGGGSVDDERRGGGGRCGSVDRDIGEWMSENGLVHA
jgi:hypothetical protein